MSLSRARIIVSRSPQLVDVGTYGVVGDGVTDDTPAIVAALAAASAGGGSHVLLAGRYATTGFSVPSGVFLLSLGATLVLPADSAAETTVVTFSGVANAGILGALSIEGSRASQAHVGDAGQIGVRITQSSDIYIESLVTRDMSKDGLYIGLGAAPCTGVVVGRFVAEGSGRNGCSVTNVDGLRIGYLEARGSVAGTTGDGVDIEPNGADDFMSNISIDTLYAHDNFRNGLKIEGASIRQGGISIGTLLSRGNTTGAWLSDVTGLRIASGDVSHNTGMGVAIPRNVRNLTLRADVHHNGSRGISGVLSAQSDASRLWDFSGVRCYNNSQSNPGTADGIRIDSDSDDYPIERVLVQGAALFDDQDTPTQRYGITTGGSSRVKRVVAEAFAFGNATGAANVLGADSSFALL